MPSSVKADVIEIRWRFPVGTSPASYRAKLAKHFGECLEDNTEGRLKIEPIDSWPDSVRIGLPALTEEIDMVALLGMSSHYFHDKPLFEIATLGMLATNQAEADRLWQAAKRHIADQLNENNLHLLFTTVGSPELLVTKKEIRSLTDFKGLRMWAYFDHQIDLAKSIGIEPYQNDGGNGARDALWSGLVEAALLSSTYPKEPRYIESLRQGGVTHAYNIGVWVYRSVATVNRQTWLNLPDAMKTAVSQCGRKTEKHDRTQADQRATNRLTWLQNAEIIVVDPSEKLMRELDAAGETIVADWVNRVGTKGQEIIDHYRQEQ